MTPRFEALGGITGGETTQLTRTRGMVIRVGGVSTLGFAWNGLTFQTFTGTPPFYLQPRFIFPIYHTSQDSYVARDGSDFYLVSASNLSLQSQINPPAGYELISPYSMASPFSSYIWWLIEHSVSNERFLAPASSISSINTLQQLQAFNFSASLRKGTNVGGFFIKSPSDWTSAFPAIDVEYIYFGPNELPAASYKVLQRNGMEYTLIEQESYPIRVEISNSTPVLTVGSGDLSFKSNYIYSDTLEVVFSAVASGVRQVNDYRYSLLEPTSSGVTSSGLGVEQLGLYVYESGVFAQNILLYSGGWQPIYGVPSGHGTRIETSNYGLGGQYVFVTASGFVQTFYQKDPMEVGFTAYSGMPQSRATIIRLDDRM
jgi:hypothetical protein